MAHPDPSDDPRIFEGPQATARLAALGIPLEALTAALDAGDVAARQADEFSPVTTAGTLRWHETVRMLRERLAAEGWSCNDDRNSPRSVAPSGTHAVVAVSGTADTGLREGTPRSSHPRGVASARAVQINGQLVLDLGTVLLADMSAEKLSQTDTYYLLYYRTQGDELRAELSLPTFISEKGVFLGWRERILLPPRDFGAAEKLPRDAGGDGDLDFGIAVR